MASLALSVRNKEGICIIDLAGRVTFGEPAAQLREALRREAAENPKVILNMAQVSFVDSAGLGELVGCYTAMLNRRGSVKLACLQSRIIDLMRMTRLRDLFEIYDTEQAAMDSFGIAARS